MKSNFYQLIKHKNKKFNTFNNIRIGIIILLGLNVLEEKYIIVPFIINLNGKNDSFYFEINRKNKFYYK